MEGYFGENISGFSFKLNILLKDSPRLLIRRQSKCIEKARQAYLHLSLPLSFPPLFFLFSFLGPLCSNMVNLFSASSLYEIKRSVTVAPHNCSALSFLTCPSILINHACSLVETIILRLGALTVQEAQFQLQNQIQSSNPD